MPTCDDCPIDDKIYECCGRFPETGESTILQITQNRCIHACPNLNPNGQCAIYENRPLACRVHYCHGYDSISDIRDGYAILKNQWEDGENIF